MDKQLSDARERFIKSLPGEAVIAFGLGETLILNQTTPYSPETVLTLQLILFGGVMFTFILKMISGIPGRSRKITPELLVYSLVIAIEGYLYAIALFSSALIDLAWQSQVGVLTTFFGFILAVLIPFIFSPDERYLRAVSEFNVGASVAHQLAPKVGADKAAERAIEYLKRANRWCKGYVNQARLDDPDFIGIENAAAFKAYYDSLSNIEPKLFDLKSKCTKG
jgi:hypothetical protein